MYEKIKQRVHIDNSKITEAVDACRLMSQLSMILSGYQDVSL